jgi:gamma-butyrobetaine dioxygenase
MSSSVQEIENLFDRLGGEQYGEGVSQSEHARQCAALAEKSGAAGPLVAAALLHDIGHLIEQTQDNYGNHRHDRSGGAWLAERFGPEVSEPVRLHVAAKRYLCAVEPGYFDLLSPASVYSLEKQGGPMSPEEVEAFRTEPAHAEAVALRRWDDEGKVVGAKVPDFAHYQPLLESLVRA